jgi:hypothetical protein
MSEHTKEPWNVGFIEDVPGEKYWVIGGDSLLFARLPSNHPVMLANAERIVACVNYCAGIPTDVLTTYSPPEDGLREAARAFLANEWIAGNLTEAENPDKEFAADVPDYARHCSDLATVARNLRAALAQYDAAALGGKE